MPTLYHGAVTDKALIIQGLDAHSAYLSLYMGDENKGNFYTLGGILQLYFSIGSYTVCFNLTGKNRKKDPLII